MHEQCIEESEHPFSDFGGIICDSLWENIELTLAKLTSGLDAPLIVLVTIGQIRERTSNFQLS